MNEHTCLICNDEGPVRVRLEHEQSGDRITLCSRCLRSNLRMKADIGDLHGRHLLEDVAADGTVQIWRSQHIMYLLPELDVPRATPERRPLTLEGRA